jgi:UrcA family protein
VKTRILWAGLAVLAATQAIAGSLDSTPARSITVRYGDLNLSDRSGVNALHARIDYAARMVCGEGQLVDLERFSIYQTCVQHARDAALAQIKLPAR